MDFVRRENLHGHQDLGVEVVVPRRDRSNVRRVDIRFFLEHGDHSSPGSPSVGLGYAPSSPVSVQSGSDPALEPAASAPSHSPCEVNRPRFHPGPHEKGSKVSARLCLRSRFHHIPNDTSPLADATTSHLFGPHLMKPLQQVVEVKKVAGTSVRNVSSIHTSIHPDTIRSVCRSQKCFSVVVRNVSLRRLACRCRHSVPHCTSVFFEFDSKQPQMCRLALQLSQSQLEGLH